MRKEKLKAMYRYFESLKVNPIKLEDMSVFYTDDVEMIINESLVSKGRVEFFEHFEHMLTLSRDYRFVFADDAFIDDGKRVAVKYRIDMTKQGEPKVLYVIAYFEFVDGLISKWDEVVAEASPQELGL